MVCMAVDLEKERVLRTKRARRCRSVQFQHSTCAISPVSLPTWVSWSSGMTAWYAFQKSEKQCTLRYSSGILFHNSRHVFSLLSPIALATTCRVFLHKAIHIHTLFTFFKTNDHKSSNSNIVASGSFVSGVINVSFGRGNFAAFFYPISHCITRYFKCSCQSSQTAALLICSHNLFSALFCISIWCWIFTTLSLAWLATISLLSIRRMTVSY